MFSSIVNVQLVFSSASGLNDFINYMFTLECEIHSHNVCLCIKSIALYDRLTAIVVKGQGDTRV